MFLLVYNGSTVKLTVAHAMELSKRYQGFTSVRWLFLKDTLDLQHDPEENGYTTRMCGHDVQSLFGHSVEWHAVQTIS